MAVGRREDKRDSSRRVAGSMSGTSGSARRDSEMLQYLSVRNALLDNPLGYVAYDTSTIARSSAHCGLPFLPLTRAPSNCEGRTFQRPYVPRSSG